MKLGMVGLGRMGSSMTERLVRAGHECVVFDRDAAAISKLAEKGATAAGSYADMMKKLDPPRVVWLMIPAAVVDSVIEEIVELVGRDAVVIDGGNSHYRDDIRRAKELAARGIHYLDVGTSGGVWGRDRGYCQMIGGEAAIVKRVEPIFVALAPGLDRVPQTPGRTNTSTAECGYLHCGPAGAGHFVKMVHNGIEYGVMAAYAEGLNILQHANAGARDATADAETAPIRDREHYRYNFDIAEVVEVWRRGSVITSWLLDLAASAFVDDPDLEQFSKQVSDSGEGRWTLQAAIDEGVPAPVLAVALALRFSSRGADDFANRVLSAMRFQFGGHGEKSK